MLILLIISIYSLDFLREVPDARGVSLSFSDISENSINLITVNPFLLPDFLEFNFGNSDFAGLSNFYSLGLSIPLKNLKTGILWVRAEVENIPEYPELPENDTIPKEKIGEFSNTEEAFILPFKYKNYPLAMQFKIINKRLKNLKGKGIGFDIGTRKSFNLKNIKIFLGLSILNPFGTKISWNSGKKDEEVRNFISFIAFKKRFLDLFELLFASKLGYDIEIFYAAGFEIKIKRIFSLILGYEKEPRIGAGITFKNFEAYYSLRLHELGKIQTVSIKLKS